MGEYDRWSVGVSSYEMRLEDSVVCRGVLRLASCALRMLLRQRLLAGTRIRFNIPESNSIALLCLHHPFVDKRKIATRIVAGLLIQRLLDPPLIFEYMVRDHMSVSVNNSIGVTISGINSFNRVFMIAMCCFLLAFAR